MVVCQLDCGVHHDFRQTGQPGGKFPEVRFGIQDMVQINEVNFPVFEPVQPVPLFFKGSGSSQRLVESLGKRLHGFAKPTAPYMGCKQGKKGFIVETDEVLP